MNEQVKIEPEKGASWISIHLPKMLGVKYALCTPIIAGGEGLRKDELGKVTSRKDIVGRDIDLHAPPKDAVFYNLVADTKRAKKFGQWQLDYISGDSDPLPGHGRLNNGNLVYWSTIDNLEALQSDDAIIVRMADAGIEITGDDETIDRGWLCLRRVGDMDGKVFDERGKLLIRTLKDGEIIIKPLENPRAVVGRVFSRFIVKKHDHVKIAKKLPFAKEIYTPPDAAITA